VVRRPTWWLAALVTTWACGAGPRASGQETSPLAGRVLAPYASRRVLVLPALYLRSGDSLGFAAKVTNDRDYLDEVDAEIAFALRDRGVKKLWVFPPQLARAARRNAPYAPDIYDLAAQWLRPPVKKIPDQLPEPLASQIRTLIALEEDAQFLLLPVEVRFEPAGPGQECAVIRVVVLDGRLSRIAWMADIAGDPSATFSPALVASAAEHLANLVGEP